MKKSGVRITLTLIIAVVAMSGMMVLLAVWGSGPPAAHAQAGTGTIRVATTGTDAPGCGGAANPCRTVQYAVDAASDGDVIKVATGVYTDVHARAGITQVVYISKTLTIRGGYTTTNWNTSDPTANPTTLDAQGLGRVMVISGAITPAVEGLRITGGSATGVGDDGGGVYVYQATVTISNCVVLSNTTSFGGGGGLFLEDTNYSLLENNTVEGNDAIGNKGGGIGLWSSDNVTLRNNLVTDNVVIGNFGGGISIQWSNNVTLTNNTVSWNGGNKGAGANGGGLYVYQSDNITLRGNTISNNVANVVAIGKGGGLYLWSSDNVVLRENVVYSNTASLAGDGWGGGVYLAFFSGLQMSDNTLQENRASTARDGSGGGLYLQSLTGSVAVTNNQILSNTASTASHGWGGGAYFYNADGAAFDDNTVLNNTASSSVGGHNGLGGGFLAYYSDNLALNDNTFIGNTAGASGDSWGGALGLEFSNNVTLSGNTVRNNIANTSGDGTGGGLYIELSDYTALNGNTVVSNTATLGTTAVGWGGGLAVESSGSFTLTNNLVADNQANTQGSGLWFGDDPTHPTSGRLLHTTIADNHSSGQGVFIGQHSTLAFTNTIIAGHASVGITVTTGSTATLEATLWHNNGTDTGGAGVLVTGTVNVYNDPAFVAPGAGDYHIGGGSAARDAGVNAGVTTDIDGEARPQGAGYDLGADEWYPAAVCREDVNGDGVISIVDIQMVAAGLGGSDPNLDMEPDGDVDIADVQQVAGRWRDSC